eukprot:TRINITY_DN15541_c0_g1_i1.p1 TRINITY_DN15541_c0_g1~~TRINITY_DN15541_c0_g1_i1.p1  ORF type:complete len:282 (+),score=38.45 TRINITY_DN15541_c0_g1_i1:169-1014(+)
MLASIKLGLRLLGWSCSIVEISPEKHNSLLGLNSHQTNELEKENSQILLLVVPSVVENEINFDNFKIVFSNLKDNITYYGVENKQSEFHVEWGLLKNTEKILYKLINDKADFLSQKLFTVTPNPTEKSLINVLDFNNKLDHYQIKTLIRNRRSVTTYEKKKMDRYDFLALFSIFYEMYKKPNNFPLDGTNWDPCVLFFCIYLVKVRDMERGFYIFILDNSLTETLREFYTKKQVSFRKQANICRCISCVSQRPSLKYFFCPHRLIVDNTSTLVLLLEWFQN